MIRQPPIFRAAARIINIKNDSPYNAPPVIDRQMKAREWGLLITLSLLWGGSFFFNGVAVQELPTLTIVFGRVAIAAVALYGLMRIIGQPLPGDVTSWQAFGIMGLLNNFIPFCLIVWGQQEVASGLASIFNATTPIFTILVAHFLIRDEPMTPARLGGVLIGFVGVAAMLGHDIVTGFSFTGFAGHIFAQMALLGAALSYGCAASFGRRFSRMGISPLATATGQIIASSVMLLPVMLIVDQPWQLALPSVPVMLSIVGVALLSTALAYILFFNILKQAGATNLSLVTLLIPVSAICLGVMFLDETIDVIDLCGLGLIGIGLLCVDGRFLHWLNNARH